MAGIEFDMDPGKLKILQAGFEDNSKAVKQLKDFLGALDMSLKQLDSSALSAAKKNIDAIIKSLKDQEKNVNAVVYLQNQQKIISLQQLALNKNLTVEAQKQIAHEMRKLDLQNDMLETGYEAALVARAHTKTTEEDVKAYGAELVTTSALTKEAQKRLELEVARANATEKFVKIGNDIVKINESDLKTGQEEKKNWDDKNKSQAKQLAGMAGLDLSLGGILQKLIEGYDATNRLGAMSKQITTHWSNGSAHIEEMKDKVMELSKSFEISVDVAGQYLKQLSIAGMQHKDLTYFANELYAREVATGQSIDSQVASIKELRMEYGQTNKMATGFLEEVRHIQKALPYLNMDEITSDIMNLGQNAKAFNTDLLGTIGMYKTLMRDSRALQATGLGALPRSFRKEMAEGLSKISAEAPLGMKAFYGMGMGGVKTPAEAALKFEKLAPFKQLELIVDKMTKKVLPNAPEAAREIGYRQMLGGLGTFSNNMVVKLAELMAKGTLTPEKVRALQAQEKAERPGWVRDVVATGQAQTAAIDEGMAISKDLLGLLKSIELAISNFIIDLLRGIQESLARLTDMMPKWLKVDDKETQTAVEYYEKGGGTVSQNLWSDLTSDKMHPGYGMKITDEFSVAREKGSQGAHSALAQVDKLIGANSAFKGQFDQLGISRTREGLLNWALDAGRLSARTHQELRDSWRSGDMEEFYSIVLSELRDTGRLFRQRVKRKVPPKTAKAATPVKSSPLDYD